MQTIVTARHCEIPDDLKAHAIEAVTKTAKVAHRPQRAQVVFDADGGRRVVELQLHLPRARLQVASAEGDDFRSALDAAVAKLRNQLDKNPAAVRRRAVR